jgi:hypothetical protein
VESDLKTQRPSLKKKQRGGERRRVSYSTLLTSSKQYYCTLYSLHVGESKVNPWSREGRCTVHYTGGLEPINLLHGETPGGHRYHTRPSLDWQRLSPRGEVSDRRQGGVCRHRGESPCVRPPRAVSVFSNSQTQLLV